MHPTYNWKAKLALFITILWPILLTQIGYNLMSLFDTMMSGWSSPEDLAGVAIGSSLWLPIMIGFGGILLAIVPIVAQHLGGGKQDQIVVAVTQGLYLSVMLSILIAIGGFFAVEPILTLMDLDTQVHLIAKHYLIGISLGLLPFFASNVLRNFFDAQGYTKITMVITLLAVPFNIVLNYILIFGKLGFPEMGGIGAGYATAVTYWLILGISIAMAFRVEAMRVHRLFLVWFKPSLRAWKEQLGIGLPMGLSIFFEASIFSGVTLLMGASFDTYTIAAHQAAISFTSLMFMVPLSMSMALTIIIAYEVGARRLRDAHQYTRLGVGMAIVVLGMCSVLLYIFREQVALMYSDHPTVVSMAMQFYTFAIFYQLSDAAQASLQGVLRGYKDATVPFITALISYWGIGLPSGYALASYTNLGPYGYWVGITIGLTCAAVGFYARLIIVQKREQSAKAAHQ